MRTDALITLLATGSEPVNGNAAARRLALALSWGAPGALLQLMMTLGLREDLAQALAEPMFWGKLLFAAGLALAATLAVERLARPGVQLGRVWAGLAAPLALLWLLAAAVLLAAAPEQRPALLMGQTWASCPFNIALLSLPLFAATLWAMRGLAPTRPALAGAGCGLLAGALAALVYALHCPESTAPFVAIWYLLGIAIPALAGAALGPRLLRW